VVKLQTFVCWCIYKIYILRVLTLTYFSRSQRSNFKNIHNVIQLRQLLPISPSTFHLGYIWQEFVSCNLRIMSPSLYWLVTDSWIVCGWIVSLAQTFLHCKTFSSDVAEYRICKATFYSTQRWIGPLFRLKKKCSGWRAALTENHKVKQCKTCKRSVAFSIWLPSKRVIKTYGGDLAARKAWPIS
jgi:hypothetical protein